MLSILEPPLCSDLRELCWGETGWGSGFTSGGHRAGLPHGPAGEQEVTDLCREPVAMVFSLQGHRRHPCCCRRHCSSSLPHAGLHRLLYCRFHCSGARLLLFIITFCALLPLFLLSLFPSASPPSSSSPLSSSPSSPSSHRHSSSVPSFLDSLRFSSPDNPLRQALLPSSM